MRQGGPKRSDGVAAEFTSLQKIFKREDSVAGFTLIELLVVVIIIGVLAAIGIPNYLYTREKALDREAISALKLIQAANKQYYSQTEIYFPYGGTYGTQDINDNLYLDLEDRHWNYAIGSAGAGYQATATRVGGTRYWLITEGMPEATCQADCLN